MIAVREDAKETTELDTGAPASAEEDHPPGFVSAAKREHQNEAAALRHHRIEFGTQAKPLSLFLHATRGRIMRDWQLSVA